MARLLRSLHSGDSVNYVRGFRERRSCAASWHAPSCRAGARNFTPSPPRWGSPSRWRSLAGAVDLWLAAKKFGGGFRKLLDSRAELHSADGLAGLFVGGQLEARAFAGVEPGDVSHFVEIVIFGGKPKYGDCGDAAGVQFTGDLNGGERLVDGVSGARKQTDLLAETLAGRLTALVRDERATD